MKKIIFTLVMRPRMRSGVPSCRMMLRNTMLTVSAAPVAARHRNVSQNTRENPDASAETPAEHEQLADQPVAAHEGDAPEAAESVPNEADLVPPPLAPDEPHPAPDGDAARVIAKVRKLMLVSMAVTLIAVGSVFAFIGYRVFKGDGTTAKTADKLPEANAIPADMTLALPRGARVVQSAVAGDRLVITLENEGKIEVRTFDVNTLQPAGRLNFSGTP